MSSFDEPACSGLCHGIFREQPHAGGFAGLRPAQSLALTKAATRSLPPSLTLGRPMVAHLCQPRSFGRDQITDLSDACHWRLCAELWTDQLQEGDSDDDAESIEVAEQKCGR